MKLIMYKEAMKVARQGCRVRRISWKPGTFVSCFAGKLYMDKKSYGHLDLFQDRDGFYEGEGAPVWEVLRKRSAVREVVSEGSLKEAMRALRAGAKVRVERDPRFVEMHSADLIFSDNGELVWSGWLIDKLLIDASWEICRTVRRVSGAEALYAIARGESLLDCADVTYDEICPELLDRIYDREEFEVVE